MWERERECVCVSVLVPCPCVKIGECPSCSLCREEPPSLVTRLSPRQSTSPSSWRMDCACRGGFIRVSSFVSSFSSSAVLRCSRISTFPRPSRKLLVCAHFVCVLFFCQFGCVCNLCILSLCVCGCVCVCVPHAFLTHA